jgi:hypothetical protein
MPTLRRGRTWVFPKEHPRCLREKRSFDPGDRAYWVDMPPESSATIEVRARPAYPWWPKTRYAVGFSTIMRHFPRLERTALGSVVLSPFGPQGTRIQTWTAQSHEEGATPVIKGRTSPPLRKGRISIRAVRASAISLGQWGNPAPYTVRLGSVTTDHRGRFQLPSQRFPFSGRYALLARSEAHGGLASDWNCGPFFRTR